MAARTEARVDGLVVEVAGKKNGEEEASFAKEVPSAFSPHTRLLFRLRI